MEQIWEFLENNSPKLVCKESRKQDAVGDKGCVGGRAQHKAVGRLLVEKVGKDDERARVGGRVLTVRNEKSPIVAKPQLRKNITPVQSCKKFLPVLLTTRAAKNTVPLKAV